MQVQTGLSTFCGLLSLPKNGLTEESVESDEENGLEIFLANSENEQNISVGSIKNVGSDLIEKLNFSFAKCKQLHCNNIKCILLPYGFSQATINGRNGSSACTVIAVVTSYGMLSSKKFNIDDAFSLFIGSMEIGNCLYTKSQFLTIFEAEKITDPYFEMHIKEEKNIFLSSLSESLEFY